MPHNRCHDTQNEKFKIIHEECSESEKSDFFERYGIGQKISGMMFGIRRSEKQNEGRMCCVQHDLQQHEFEL
jgi:hypothetical protein